MLFVTEAYICLQQQTSKMQPQQQSVTVQPVPVQPVYVAQPYQTATVVNTYGQRQSMVIGILLIIGGCLSILFNIIDLAIGTQDKFTKKRYDYYNYYYYDDETLSHYSNGVAAHGFWCGVPVRSCLILIA